MVTHILLVIQRGKLALKTAFQLNLMCQYNNCTATNWSFRLEKKTKQKKTHSAAVTQTFVPTIQRTSLKLCLKTTHQQFSLFLYSSDVLRIARATCQDLYASNLWLSKDLRTQQIKSTYLSVCH